MQWFGSSPNFILRLTEFSGLITNWTTKLHTNHPWLVLVLLVQLVAIASGQVKESDCAKARSHLNSAQAAIDAQDSVTALRELNQAVHIAPRCADAYLMLGLIEFRNGATADAIQNYQRAILLRPRSYSIHYDLALAYLKEQKLQEARTQLEEAVKLDPSQADAMYNLGMVLEELGQASESLVKLQRAKALDPKRPDVTFNIVRVQLELGLVSAARAEARNSAKQFGRDSHWCGAIGQLFLQKDQPNDAVPYLQRAVGNRPDDAEFRHQLAVAYLRSGQADEVLRTVIEPKTADDHYLRASAYYLSHQYHEADSESEEALHLAPDSPQILVLRTRLLQRAGDQDEALRMAQKTIALAPTWDQPYYLAGVSSYFIRLYEEAVKNLARALELNPKSSRALFVQYLALANLGKLSDAESSLRRAIALQPTNARLHCHLGILLGREYRTEEGEQSFRKAIQLKPEYALSHYELGKLLASSGHFRRAAQELEQAIRYDPGLTSGYYQLGRIYLKLGESEKSAHMLAEFNRLHKQDQEDPQDDQAHRDDAKKEVEAQ
ncbi:MAG TPA: tetratricopeptide repeat protein [Candidatus Sulfotelmatobacter sp.]|nr:tetratricopeptide repeat protein [Candidatus Sulfotelmatobacter sp.]